MTKNYKGIGFDLGGVMVAWGIPLRLGYLSHKLDVETALLEKIYRSLAPDLEVGKLAHSEFWKKLLSEVGSTLDPAGTEHYWTDNYVQNTPFLPGMIELVDTLRDNYRVGLLSNIDHKTADINRERGFFGHFDAVVTSDMLHKRKPERGAYQALADALGVSMHELVFVDDSYINIDAANGFGVTGVLFTDYRKLTRQLAELGIKG